MPILSARVGLQHALHTQNVLSVPADANGRAHFVLSQHRTETQRIASGTDDDEDDKVRESLGGNIQNKKDLERSIFCAGSEEYVFVEADWSQIELRDMAWLARDTDLLGALGQHWDIHSLNASAIFGCGESRSDADSFLVPFEGRMVSARHAAKRATHGWDYGMGARKTGRMYQPCAKMALTEVAALVVRKWQESGRNWGVSPDTVRRLVAGGPLEHSRLYEYGNTATAAGWIAAYFKRWPGLKAFQDATIARVERDGFLTNSFDYRLKFWNFEWKNGRRVCKDREEALAFPPQSDVAFMTKTLLRHEGQIDSCFKRHGGELLITNHDAFAGRVPKTALADFVPAARALMERPWPQLGEIEGFGQFSVPADFMVGWNWGKRHVHGERCDPKTCDMIENPRGLVDYKEGIIGL